MIYELYYENLNERQWNRIAEQYSRGGYGSSVRDAIAYAEKITKDLLNQGMNFNDYDFYYEFVSAMGEKFETIGTGTQRTVISLDDDHVMKLALSQNGANANKKESNSKVHGLLGELIPKVYASDKNGLWIVIEKVRTIKGYKEVDEWFKKLFSGVLKIHPQIIDFDLFEKIMMHITGQVVKGKKSASKALSDYLDIMIIHSGGTLDPEELKKEIMSEPAIIKLIRLIEEEGALFLRILNDFIEENIGFDADGNPLIIDWG